MHLLTIILKMGNSKKENIQDINLYLERFYQYSLQNLKVQILNILYKLKIEKFEIVYVQE